MKLYEISEQIRAIMADAEETGEIDSDRLTGLEMDFSDKCESVAVIIRELSAGADVLKAEIDRLSDRKRALENRAEWLKDYLRTNMEATGEAKIKGRLFTITLGKPSQVVAINGDVPAEYTVTKVTPDKTAIGRALKSGQSVQGAELVEGKAKLLIK